VLFLLATVLASGAMCQSARVMAQAKKGTPDAAEQQPEPTFREYKGVSIGMSTQDARKKLGSPAEKSDDQDFFVFSDTETAQVYYDKSQKVSAISINYLGQASSIPQPKTVLGTDVEAKPDGAMHKLVRFPKAGYWVSYSRTAGADPLITITMKKME
jgi:hypothetical protein